MVATAKPFYPFSFHQMKQLLYLVFGLLLLAGCSKKSDDPTPTPPAQAVAGLYTMSSLTTNGQTIPLPFVANGISMSGTINLVVVADKQDEADMTLTLKVTGSPDTTGNGTVQVKAASKGYELFDSGQKIGTVEGNMLTLTDNGDIIVAKK
jgi:PBP1b-binding outer membrane lipoprotein LpoB